MSTFVKAVVIVLVTVILSLVLPKNAGEFHVVLSLGACSIVLLIAGSFLQPIINTIYSLIEIGHADHEMVRILLKATGIAILSEYVILICQDAGNSALGKSLQVLSSAVILWLSLPMITGLMDIIKKLLAAV